MFSGQIIHTNEWYICLLTFGSSKVQTNIVHDRKRIQVCLTAEKGLSVLKAMKTVVVLWNEQTQESDVWKILSDATKVAHEHTSERLLVTDLSAQTPIDWTGQSTRLTSKRQTCLIQQRNCKVSINRTRNVSDPTMPRSSLCTAPIHNKMSCG